MKSYITLAPGHWSPYMSKCWWPH